MHIVARASVSSSRFDVHMVEGATFLVGIKLRVPPTPKINYVYTIRIL